MRKIINLNENWLFVKNTTDITNHDGVTLNLPHTWNAEDGFDGGNDYFRGTCLYQKKLAKADLGTENVEALKRGAVNLEAHIDNLQKYGVPVVVAINRFGTDSEAELRAGSVCWQPR